jgi:hypothetical protein
MLAVSEVMMAVFNTVDREAVVFATPAKVRAVATMRIAAARRIGGIYPHHRITEVGSLFLSISLTSHLLYRDLEFRSKDNSLKTLLLGD